MLIERNGRLSQLWRALHEPPLWLFCRYSCSGCSIGKRGWLGTRRASIGGGVLRVLFHAEHLPRRLEYARAIHSVLHEAAVRASGCHLLLRLPLVVRSSRIGSRRPMLSVQLLLLLL